MKATHKGTCQVCGSVQKLPGDNLSKHGYTTRFGFFEGVCCGAGYKPLEVACDRVQAGIDAALRSIDVNEARRAEVLASDKFYLSRTTKYGVLFFEAKDICYKDNTFHYTTEDCYGRPWKRQEFHLSADAVEAQKSLSRKRYAATFAAKIEQAKAYIAIQTNVLKTWTPKELLPL